MDHEIIPKSKGKVELFVGPGIVNLVVSKQDQSENSNQTDLICKTGTGTRIKLGLEGSSHPEPAGCT